MKYKDYYEVLGVSRTATQPEIQKAYRALARKYHPDINKAPDAEDRFKDINEAHEVLKDPEKRKKYDTLGENWRNGQDFTPPPGWQQRSTNQADFGDIFGGAGGFSDFFEAFFGGAPHSSRRGRRVSRKGEDRSAEMTIPLSDAYRGAKQEISFSTLEIDAAGNARPANRTLTVTIPAGILDGQRIRLPGQGAPPPGGGQSGDLIITVRIEQEPNLIIDGRDLRFELPIAPWEAALGVKADVPMPDGKTITVSVPPCSSTGMKLRVRGKGMPNADGNGDLFVVIKIVVGREVSAAEQELYKKLAKAASFKPRDWQK